MANADNLHKVVQKLAEIAWEIEDSPFNMNALCSDATFDLIQGSRRILHADLNKGTAKFYSPSALPNRYFDKFAGTLEDAGVVVRTPQSYNFR